MDTIIIGLRKLELVISSLSSEIRSHLSFDILTEEQKDKIELEESNIAIPINFHVVPNNYHTPNQTKFKARALHYMIQYRKKNLQNKILSNYYIIHFDAESTINSTGLKTLIFNVINKKSIKIWQGPIYYSNNWFNASIISRQLESLRPWNCYECLASTQNGNPYHLHGSNIVIRADIEVQLGWDFGLINGYPVVAEDLFFGIKAYLTHGKSIFGWHSAALIEQPAFKLLDSIKQRIRWIRGTLQAITIIPSWPEYQIHNNANKKSFATGLKIKVYLYALGFIPSIFTLGSIFYLFYFVINEFIKSNFSNNSYHETYSDINKSIESIVPQWMITLSMIGAIIWISTIQIGLYYNLKYVNVRLKTKIIEHMKILIISPFTTVIDTGVAFFTTLFWSLGFKKATWEITPKSIDQISN